MLGKLIGAGLRAGVRAVANRAVDSLLQTPAGEWSDGDVRRFQNYIRSQVYIYLINEAKEQFDVIEDPEERYNLAVKYLQEHCAKIREEHRDARDEFRELHQRELENQLGNMYPDYSKAEEYDRRAHIEAFVMIVMGEWMQKGSFILDGDENTETERFQYWRGFIDEAIQCGVVKKDFFDDSKEEPNAEKPKKNQTNQKELTRKVRVKKKCIGDSEIQPDPRNAKCKHKKSESHDKTSSADAKETGARPLVFDVGQSGKTGVRACSGNEAEVHTEKSKSHESECKKPEKRINPQIIPADDNETTSAPIVPDQDHIGDAVRNAIESIGNESFYTRFKIPSNKLANAKESMSVPKGENVYAMLDSTFWGSAKNGLLLTSYGLRWKNDWTTDSSITKLSWQELSNLIATIKVDEYDVVFKQDIRVNCAGSGVEPKDVVKVLKQIVGL